MNVNKLYCFAVSQQRGRFAGFSLYVSKSGDIQKSSMCYKNGSDIPPLNFTALCIKSGRYVIFYNERLDDVIYPEGYETKNVFTELCEVVVQGKYATNKTYLYLNSTNQKNTNNLKRQNLIRIFLNFLLLPH